MLVLVVLSKDSDEMIVGVEVGKCPAVDARRAEKKEEVRKRQGIAKRLFSITHSPKLDNAGGITNTNTRSKRGEMEGVNRLGARLSPLQRYATKKGGLGRAKWHVSTSSQKDVCDLQSYNWGTTSPCTSNDGMGVGSSGVVNSTYIIGLFEE